VGRMKKTRLEINFDLRIYRWANSRNKHVFLTSDYPGVIPNQPIDLGHARTHFEALRAILEYERLVFPEKGGEKE